MEKIDNKEDPKKILNCLLQKLLDRRLYKLEKKNHEEECTLKTINKESQKAILALEDCSHKIRKQIYLLRNKYVDERKRNENILKNQNSSNNIERNKTRNSNTNNINTTSVPPLAPGIGIKLFAISTKLDRAITSSSILLSMLICNDLAIANGKEYNKAKRTVLIRTQMAIRFLSLDKALASEVNEAICNVHDSTILSPFLINFNLLIQFANALVSLT